MSSLPSIGRERRPAVSDWGTRLARSASAGSSELKTRKKLRPGRSFSHPRNTHKIRYVRFPLPSNPLYIINVYPPRPSRVIIDSPNFSLNTYQIRQNFQTGLCRAN